MAKIRHIVFHSMDPERLAKFYVEVMGLEIVHRAKNGGISLTDGYMNLSIHTNKIDASPADSTISDFWSTTTRRWRRNSPRAAGERR
jgi:catechol 2,3-dioxygenase-like lactoylglutathione lyase family enzyme